MPQPDCQDSRPDDGTVVVCDRCGDVTIAPAPCTCATPYDPLAVLRRLRTALELGSRGSATGPTAARRTAPPAA